MKPLHSLSHVREPFNRYSIYASTRIYRLIAPLKDTVFVHETAPQLKSALEEEAAAAQGHVDAFRRSIINRPRPRQTSRRDNLGSGQVRGLVYHSRCRKYSLHTWMLQSYEQTLFDIERQFANSECAVFIVLQARF